MAPKDVHIVSTRNRERGKKDYSGVIIEEFVIILDCSVLCKWARHDHRGPYKRDAGVRDTGGEVMIEAQARVNLEHGGRFTSPRTRTATRS